MPEHGTRWYGPIIDKFREWANSDSAVRATFIVASQARSDVAADEWSDLDVVIFHSDPSRLIALTEWFQTFGTVVLSTLAASPRSLSKPTNRRN